MNPYIEIFFVYNLMVEIIQVYVLLNFHLHESIFNIRNAPKGRDVVYFHWYPYLSTLLCIFIAWCNTLQRKMEEVRLATVATFNTQNVATLGRLK